MNAEILVTILCGLAITVGIAGTIIPVLPGSILIAASLLAWALWGGAGVAGWVVFGIGLAFVVASMAAGAVLTGRRLKQHSIPGRSVVVGIVLSIVGMFIMPVVGLVAGFAVGLFASEVVRTRNARTAVKSSVAALKATGLGILAEFGLACLAASTWVVGVWVNVVS
jgi:uncharacterized protein